MVAPEMRYRISHDEADEILGDFLDAISPLSFFVIIAFLDDPSIENHFEAQFSDLLSSYEIDYDLSFDFDPSTSVESAETEY